MSDEKSKKVEILAPVSKKESQIAPTKSKGITSYGLDIVRTKAALRLSQLQVKIAEQSNLFDAERNTRIQLELDRIKLESKFENIEALKDIAKLEVEVEHAEQEKKKAQLQQDQELHSLEGDARIAALHAQIAKSKAQQAHFNSLQAGSAKETRAQTLTKLQNELDATLDKYKQAEVDADGNLDEATARNFDIKIGKLRNKINDIEDTEEPDSGLFEE